MQCTELSKICLSLCSVQACKMYLVGQTILCVLIVHMHILGRYVVKPALPYSCV